MPDLCPRGLRKRRSRNPNPETTRARLAVGGQKRTFAPGCANFNAIRKVDFRTGKATVFAGGALGFSPDAGFD